jgi:hypothetical protein
MVLERFLLSKVSQRPRRVDSIIHIPPLQQSLIEFRYIEAGICYLVELLVMKVISSLPAIEGLRRDAKIATGEASVLIRGTVVIESFKSLPGFL